jgi:hypothetical protein
MTVLMIRVIERSSGLLVESQLREVQAEIGQDFSHASSHILKDHLEADSRWQEFIGQCGKTQPKVKQTVLGALAPPTQKVKGRYMNIGELIRWAVKMLGCWLAPVASCLMESIVRCYRRSM